MFATHPSFFYYPEMQTTNYKSVKSELDTILRGLHNESKQTRECIEYSDFSHLCAGIYRTLNIFASGRDFIQHYQMKFGSSIDVGLFFDALKSKRRTRYIKELSQKLYDKFNKEAPSIFDPFLEHRELEGYEIYASDGHSHASSDHEDPIANKKRAPCNLFSLNLRTHYLRHMAICSPQNGKKKEHEITTLKRQDSNSLRMNNKMGVKVIHAYDPACIDYMFWDKSKKKYGVYFITLEKSNSALLKQGDFPFDDNDSRNNGVILNEMVGVNNGPQLRRITYIDPVTGRKFVFITNLHHKIPPGLIAYIYKCRWDIEKAFYESKSQLKEVKSWGKTEEAKQQQCCYIALVHNLMLFCERLVNIRELILDEKVLDKMEIRKTKEQIRSSKAGREMNTHVSSSIRATNRSLQFIRWLRHQLDFSIPWKVAMEMLAPYMKHYIQ